MNKIEIAEDFHNIIGRSNYLHVATAMVTVMLWNYQKSLGD